MINKRSDKSLHDRSTRDVVRVVTPAPSDNDSKRRMQSNWGLAGKVCRKSLLLEQSSLGVTTIH